MSMIWSVGGDPTSTIGVSAPTLCQHLYVGAKVKVSAISIKTYNYPYANENMKAYVWRVSDKTLIATSSQVALTSRGWITFPISCTLEANVVYNIAFENVRVNSENYTYYANGNGTNPTTTVNGIPMTIVDEGNSVYIGSSTSNGGTVYPGMGVNTGGATGAYGAHVYMPIKIEGSVNTEPTISGSANESLGNKNLPFNINYSVNDVDSENILNIVEKLNGSQINSITNAPRNTNFNINITKEIFDSLPLNQQNTITISVTDGTATTYKTMTFTRVNSGPSITNLDKDLGQVAREGIAEKYTCHDVEGNTFTIVEKVDDIELKNITGVDGTEYTINIPQNIWLSLKNGIHTYNITATDSLGASTTRTFTFMKKETVIESAGLTKIIPTDIAATKILLTPSWLGKENADIILFQVCNNAYDVNPTWEDATSQILLNKPYIFTNKVKTATKWGIDIKFKISLKAGVTEGIEFYGIGGSLE